MKIMYRGGQLYTVHIQFTSQFRLVSDRRKFQPSQLIFHNSNTGNLQLLPRRVEKLRRSAASTIPRRRCSAHGCHRVRSETLIGRQLAFLSVVLHFFHRFSLTRSTLSGIWANAVRRLSAITDRLKVTSLPSASIG